MSAEAKHTPGPWVVDRSGFNVIRSDAAVTIAMTQPSAHMKADARLLAAAPEILASERENLTVLENLLAYLRKHETALPPLSTASLEVRIEKTRAAIAKAEGRS